MDSYGLNQYLCIVFVFKQYSRLLPKLFSAYYRFESNLRHKNLIKSNKSKTNILHSHIICHGPAIWNNLITTNKLNELLHLRIGCFEKKVKRILMNDYSGN